MDVSSFSCCDALPEPVYEQPRHEAAWAVNVSARLKTSDHGADWHAHVIEELQKPFYPDILRAPHELCGGDDAHGVGQVANKIVSRVHGIG